MFGLARSHTTRCLRAGSLQAVAARPTACRWMSTQGLGAVENPADIPTKRLYRDCIRLTYHIAAEVIEMRPTWLPVTPSC